MQYATNCSVTRALCITGGLFALIAFAAAGRQAIHPTSRACTECTGAAGTAVIVLHERLWPNLAFIAEHRRAAFFRTADGTVITQKQVAVAPIDTALLSRTRCIGSPGRGADNTQQQQNNRHPAITEQIEHKTASC